MGRPLNKKYFGNTSVPPIGGEGIASFTIGGTNNNYTAIPTVASIGAPLNGGTQAVAGAILMTAKTATVDTSGAGDLTADYEVGDVLTVVGGTGTAATFTVASVKVGSAVIQDDGTTVWTTGDTITVSGAGWTTPAVFNVAADAGAITGLQTVNAGVYTGTLLADPIAVTSATVADAGGYQNDATIGFRFDVNAVTLTSGGSYSVLPANPVATTTDSAAGEGATLNVNYGVLSIAVGTAGAGYTVAPAVSLSGGNATVTSVLTSGTGGNAIVMTGRIVAGSTVALDVIKQTGSRRYLVTDGTNTGVVTLVADAVDAAGEANIVATDSAGGTYYVTKLTAHRALLTRGTGTQFATGQSVPWTLGNATLNTTVKIPNA